MNKEPLDQISNKPSGKARQTVTIDEFMEMHKEYMKSHPIPYSEIFIIAFFTVMLHFILEGIVPPEIWYGLKFKKAFLWLFPMIIALSLAIGYNYLIT